MRIALVHYWLVRQRGGEAVLDTLMSLFPQADVYTNVYARQAMQPLFEGRGRPRTTWVDRLPFAERLYPLYLPLMAPALSGLDLDDYDVVISSEAGPAKWAMPSIDGRHICYAHTPMRYLWDQRHVYRRRTPRLAHPFYDAMGEEMRLRDVVSAYRVDDFVANSSFVARRIEKLYRRDSTVIHPPVQLADCPAPQAPEDAYLFVGHLAPYKGVRAAVDACVALGRRLVVVGEGPDRAYVPLRRPGSGAPPPPAAGGAAGPDEPLPGAALPGRGGLRHHPGGGDGDRSPGDRPGAGRGAGHGEARRVGRTLPRSRRREPRAGHP